MQEENPICYIIGGPNGAGKTTHLHVFNELGKDIMTVYDGIMSEGSHDFTFKLPPGKYYARMETIEGVVAKKLIVE